MRLPCRLITASIVLLSSPPTVAEPLQPEWLLRLPESVPVVFVAETSTSRLHRFERRGQRVALNESFYMSIGKAGPGKQRSGDQRTPVGAYFVTEQLDTTRLHEKYGVTAFPLDYPNAWDRRRDRTGSGIWVHGVDPDGGRRPALDTDGCIALPNDDLSALESLFVAGVTPVVIGESMQMVDADEQAALAAELETTVARWVKSMADGDLHSYLSLYDEEFRHWAMNRDEWAAFSLQTFGAREIEDATYADLLLLRYPGEDALFLSRFRLRVTEDGVPLETLRRLYWRRDEHGAFTIMAEDAG